MFLFTLDKVIVDMLQEESKVWCLPLS